MPDEKKFHVWWARDEIELEDQLNSIGSPKYRVVTVIWRPAREARYPEHRQPDSPSPGFVTILERNS